MSLEGRLDSGNKDQFDSTLSITKQVECENTKRKIHADLANANKTLIKLFCIWPTLFVSVSAFGVPPPTVPSFPIRKEIA